MESEHLKVEHDGLTFDVHRSGPPRGPWVVLLHGFPVDSSCYDAVLPRVHDAGLRTLTIDQRGYSPGARPEAVDDYRLDRLAGDVLGVLGHLNIAYSMLSEATLSFLGFGVPPETPTWGNTISSDASAVNSCPCS